jgi:hypothetical protein
MLQIACNQVFQNPSAIAFCIGVEMPGAIFFLTQTRQRYVVHILNRGIMQVISDFHR